MFQLKTKRNFNIFFPSSCHMSINILMLPNPYLIVFYCCYIYAQWFALLVDHFGQHTVPLHSHNFENNVVGFLSSSRWIIKIWYYTTLYHFYANQACYMQSFIRPPCQQINNFFSAFSQQKCQFTGNFVECGWNLNVYNQKNFDIFYCLFMCLCVFIFQSDHRIFSVPVFKAFW